MKEKKVAIIKKHTNNENFSTKLYRVDINTKIKHILKLGPLANY